MAKPAVYPQNLDSVLLHKNMFVEQVYSCSNELVVLGLD